MTIPEIAEAVAELPPKLRKVVVRYVQRAVEDFDALSFDLVEIPLEEWLR